MGPLVRAADAVSGEAVGMRVDLTLASGQEAVGLYVHRCVAAHYQTFASADSLTLRTCACSCAEGPALLFPYDVST